ncbi:MAG: hypothetical protein IT259_06930 [Saprospiraceae bacterium]|nr:hypothetical protein [Saprospiraceae bacterium]
MLDHFFQEKTNPFFCPIETVIEHPVFGFLQTRKYQTVEPPAKGEILADNFSKRVQPKEQNNAVGN